MPTMSDFASLLQLGAGIGIGFSLFRTPLDVRMDRFERILNSEEGAFRDSTSERARSVLRKISNARIRLHMIRRDLNSMHSSLSIILFATALINWIFLSVVTIWPNESVDFLEGAALFSSSVFSYILMGIWVEFSVRRKVGDFPSLVDDILAGPPLTQVEGEIAAGGKAD